MTQRVKANRDNKPSLYEELSQKMVIAKDDIDEELVQQPELYRKIGEQSVLADSRRDEAKALLNEVRATIDQRLRARAMRKGDKLTEAQIMNELLLDDDVKNAMSELSELTLVAAQWSILHQSCRERSNMISGLVKLHESGWFGQTVGSKYRRDRAVLAQARKGQKYDDDV